MICEYFSEAMFSGTLCFVEFAFTLWKLSRVSEFSVRKKQVFRTIKWPEGKQAKSIPQKCVWFKTIQLPKCGVWSVAGLTIHSSELRQRLFWHWFECVLTTWETVVKLFCLGSQLYKFTKPLVFHVFKFNKENQVNKIHFIPSFKKSQSFRPCPLNLFQELKTENPKTLTFSSLLRGPSIEHRKADCLLGLPAFFQVLFSKYYLLGRGLVPLPCANLQVTLPFVLPWWH